MKKRGILFLLFIVVSNPLSSQDLQRVEIDQNISIEIPLDYNIVFEGDSLMVVAFTSTGKLVIERFTLPEKLMNDNEYVDGLKHYVQGYIQGLEFGVGLELFENRKGMLNGFQTRQIRYRINNKEQIIETYFLVLDQQLYQFQYSENSLILSEDAQIIFSSIRLK